MITIQLKQKTILFKNKSTKLLWNLATLKKHSINKAEK